MKCFLLKMLLVAIVCAWAFSSMAASNYAPQGLVVWQGHKYCWYDSGWNGAGGTVAASTRKPDAVGAARRVGRGQPVGSQAAAHGSNCRHRHHL